MTEHVVTMVMAQLAARLAVAAKHEPDDIARAASFIDNDKCRLAAEEMILSIMPKHVDAEALENWVQGGTPPVARALQNPDAGVKPHARGAQQSAQAKHNAAVARFDKLKTEMEEAQRAVDATSCDLERTNEQLRIVALYRLMTEIGQQASAIALGPLYAICRAVSPHFQANPAFESTLDERMQEVLASRLKTRATESREMLERLDRYAGEPQLELNLHQAILKVVRAFHGTREQEMRELRDSGKKVPASFNVRTVRRTAAEQARSVHPAAPVMDAQDVFSGLSESTAAAATED